MNAIEQPTLAYFWKLLAWNLTQHSNILVVDADLYLRADPAPWMEAYRSELFVAHSEVGERSYRGLNSRLMYLQPDERIFELLRRAAISGNYVPYTMSEQVGPPWHREDSILPTDAQYPTPHLRLSTPRRHRTLVHAACAAGRAGGLLLDAAMGDRLSRA